MRRCEETQNLSVTAYVTHHAMLVMCMYIDMVINTITIRRIDSTNCATNSRRINKEEENMSLVPV